MSQLLFKALSERATLPSRAHSSDGGLDLYAANDALLAAGTRENVGTGVAVAIPEGKAGLIVPRSGLAAKFGISIVNAPGLIDAGYRGELQVVLLNTSKRRFKVNRGDRIAQLVIVDVGLDEPVFADELPAPNDERGAGGFGSSGR